MIQNMIIYFKCIWLIMTKCIIWANRNNYDSCGDIFILNSIANYKIAKVYIICCFKKYDFLRI